MLTAATSQAKVGNKGTPVLNIGVILFYLFLNSPLIAFSCPATQILQQIVYWSGNVILIMFMGQTLDQ